MKKEMETTNMCGVYHINQKKRDDFYGIKPGDAKAYKNKNVYECCPKGYTCSMPDSEIPDFLASHKGVKSAHHLVFEGDPFNRDRTYMTTCGYLDRVCCPKRKQTKVKLADGYHWDQEPACVLNRAAANHGIQRSEERDQQRIKDERKRKRDETERMRNELNEIYGKALKGLYDASLPSGWTSEVHFDFDIEIGGVNPTVVFSNAAKNEETKLRPHKPVESTENEMNVYEDEYGPNEQQCENYIKQDSKVVDLIQEEYSQLEREAKQLQKNGDVLIMHSECLKNGAGDPDLCVSDCQSRIEGTRCFE